MRKQDRYNFVLDYFEKNIPPVETELNYTSPYELIVAVMLSAQCTDKRINAVTPALFAAFPTVEKLAEADAQEIFPFISSVSYPNSKAKHLVEMAEKVCQQFHGVIPQTFEELTSLPGVGRKTANVVLAVAFGQARLAVDTHVYRVSRRVGLVPPSCNTPQKVEEELLRNIPHHLVASSHFWILLHGRYVCKARKPECERCGIAAACKYNSTISK